MLTANIILDATGHIKLWNARAQLLFGYARENIVGRSFAVLLEQGKGPADAVLQSAAAVGYADVSADGVREDGGRFPAQALITSLGDAASGDFSLVVRNVTEQSQAQQKGRDDDHDLRFRPAPRQRAAGRGRNYLETLLYGRVGLL